MRAPPYCILCGEDRVRMTGLYFELFFLLSALLTVQLGSGQQPTQLPTTGELANDSTIQYL